MGFKTKRTIMMLLVEIAVAVIYVVYALGAKAPATEDLSAWAILILKFIGLAILATIVFQIIFHIAYSIGVSVSEGIKKGVDGEGVDDKTIERRINATVVEDEMDGAIDTRVARFGYACAGVGFIIALFVLANGLPTLWAIHIQLASIFFGSFLEGVIKIFLYERGM